MHYWGFLKKLKLLSLLYFSCVSFNSERSRVIFILKYDAIDCEKSDHITIFIQNTYESWQKAITTVNI